MKMDKNAIGNQELYRAKDFKNEEIRLLLIKSKFFEYKQFSNDFIPGFPLLT